MVMKTTRPGYVKITMENHHRNSEFSHEKWWIFPVRYFDITRVYLLKWYSFLLTCPLQDRPFLLKKTVFFGSFLPLSWSEWPWWSVRTLPASGRCHLPRLPRGDAPTSRRRWRGRRPSDGRARKPSPPSSDSADSAARKIMEHGDLTYCNHQICDTNWFL